MAALVDGLSGEAAANSARRRQVGADCRAGSAESAHLVILPPSEGLLPELWREAKTLPSLNVNTFKAPPAYRRPR